MTVQSVRQPILLSWSGGKDSAWALHLLRQNPAYEVVALLTTLNEKFRRVAIHGFREELLDLQAEATGLPIWKVDLPFPCTNADYESRMAQICARAATEGLYGIAFGDLFLEDIRAYRIARLAGTGLEPIFPVWCADLGLTTAELARQMIAAGLRAHLTCIDPRSLDPFFAGRTFDAALLADLPPSVDPCGRRRRVPHLRLSPAPSSLAPSPVIPGDRRRAATISSMRDLPPLPPATAGPRKRSHVKTLRSAVGNIPLAAAVSVECTALASSRSPRRRRPPGPRSSPTPAWTPLWPSPPRSQLVPACRLLPGRDC